MKIEPLKDWLWKYPSGTCPEGCEGKEVARSACDKLLECKHGFWQPPCVPSTAVVIEKIKIDQAEHGGSVYINDMIYLTYDKPVKILGDKINEIIDRLNRV